MIYIFTAGVLWGLIGVFVNELNAAGASAPLISAMRMSFACLAVSLFALIRHGRKIILTDMKALLFCALLGIVSNGLFNIFYTSSIRINGMGTACVLMYTAPVFTALASCVIFRESFTSRKLAALVLNILGCILTVTGGSFSLSGINITGILAGIGSGFCYGMAAVFGRLAGNRTSPVIMSVYSYIFAAAFLCIFLRPDIAPAMNNMKILCWGFLYGLIPTAGAYLVYYIGLGRVRNLSSVPIFASVEPVIAVIIGTQIYGEKIGLMNYAGIAVVLISIIIMVKSE
ncbi:MAG: EamA family transporter [Synergistaceae bacterium]|nr:EamA family transporter [Synergistaceae bacterium]